MSSMASRPANSLRIARGFITAPDSRCDPGCLPFSRSATGTSPSCSRISGCSSSSWPSLTAHASPPGPPPTIRIPTSICSSGASVGGPIASASLNGGGKSAGRTPFIGLLARPQELGQLRRDLCQVADHAEVREVEDRSVRVLVDRDDRAGPLHPDLVLDGAGDAERDVELRRDGLARLANLGRVRVPTG